MSKSLRMLMLGAAVLSFPAVALAQTTTITTTTRTERGPLVLSPDQRTTVYKRVVREREAGADRRLTTSDGLERAGGLGQQP